MPNQARDDLFDQALSIPAAQRTAFLEQACAADVGERALAVEANEELVAHHGAAGRIAEVVEPRARADRPSRVTPDTCQSPRIQRPMPLCSICLPGPNGRL